MRPFVMLAASACLAAALARPASAQRVAGSWLVTFDSDISRNGDVVTVKKRGTGRLVLEQRGDSVVGTFAAGGLPEPARSVSGTFNGKTLVLTTGAQRRTIRVNGQPREMLTRTDWMGVVDAAGMRGTMLIQVGDRPAPARQWEAVLEAARR